jgi:hypothetical protein
VALDAHGIYHAVLHIEAANMIVEDGVGAGE